MTGRLSMFADDRHDASNVVWRAAGPRETPLTPERPAARAQVALPRRGATRPHIPENGERLARKHGVPYRFLELVCPDLDELRRRMAEREPRRSQMRGLD